jgi:hypothetical protein
MASLNGQTIASSYEQLLHTDTDGGGNGNTLVTIKDGDNGTVFGLKLATNKVEVIPSAADDANAFEVSQNDGTAVFTVDTSTPSATFTSDVFIAENIKHTGDTDTRIRMLNDNVIIYAGNENQVDIGNAITVFNEGGGDNDLRIESSGNANMFYVDAGNNRVGIGTDSPSEVLQVNHSASDGDSGILIVNESTSIADDTFLGGIGFDSADGNIPSTVGEASAAIVARSAEAHGTGDKGGNLLFLTSAIDDDDDTGSHERMRITSEGNVGIGDSSPSTALSHFGSASRGLAISNQQPTISFTDTDVTKRAHIAFEGTNRNFYISSPESDGIITFHTGGYNERIRITSGGRVGIGITAPDDYHSSNQLVIGNTSGEGQMTIVSNGSNSGSLVFADATSGTGEQDGILRYDHNANEMQFFTTGHKKMTVSGSGLTVTQGYPILAGRAATDGGRILAGHYNLGGGDVLAVLSTQYSSGAFIVGYGVEGKENASGYVSTNDAFSGVRTAMQLDTDGVQFLTSSATQASPGTDITMTQRWKITPTGNFEPGSDNAFNVGSSSKQVSAIFTANAVTVSDETKKENIKDCDLGIDFINTLKPKSYNLKNLEETHDDYNKKHYGLIAQDLKDGKLKDSVFGDKDGEYGLNYNDLIAPLIKAVQELSAKVEALENA